MKNTLKRLLALVLTIAMVCGILPAMAFAADAEEVSAEFITAADDALVQADILDDIDAYFDASDKRGSERTLADYVAAADDVKELVMASDTYVEGSIVERGDGFFWQTDTGITCGYFPKDRYEADQRVATKSVNTSSLATWNYAAATKKDVCLVGPMYSEDSSFTNQYTNEALAIAEATGGTAYGLIDSAANVNTIAQAIEKCGVVIFDSHGNTDWGYFDGGSNGQGTADCTSQANTSYLCLSSGTGMTTSDCAYVTGTYGTYPHAYKSSSGNYVADGTAFANHMSSNAPGSMLWMAICLGMATNGLCAPLRNKGVSVVYGYSQSVSFTGDYKYEASFWDSMIAGNTVATAVSGMKSSLGYWDPAYSSYSYSTAVKNYCAFPIVASEQDTYPGQGNVDTYQTVKSTWTLLSQYTVTATTNNSAYGTVSVSGNTITATPATGYYAASYTVTSGTATVTQNGNTFTVDASSDCTVQINFAAKASVTVTYSVPEGVTQAATTGYAGDAITLPTPSGEPTGGSYTYSFLGWVTAPVEDSQTRPTFYAAGSAYTPAANVTLYALYSYSVSSEGSSGPALTKMVAGDTIADGDNIVLVAHGTNVAAYQETYNTNYINKFTFDGSAETVAADAKMYWTVNYDSDTGYYYLGDPENSYLYTTDESKTYLALSSEYAYLWTLVDNGDGTFKLEVIDDYETAYYFAYRTDSSVQYWMQGKSTQGVSDLDIYKFSASGGSTNYYTTVISGCSHTSTSTVTVDATCTAEGSVKVVCDSCGAVISTKTLPALGHDFVFTSTVAPTATTSGYDLYTCSRCDATEQRNEVAALGYTATFSVPNGATAPASVSGLTVTMPNAVAAPASYDAQSYVFAGWATVEADDVTAAPTLYAAGAEVTLEANTTFYAVYTYTVGGASGSGNYVKVTSTPADWSGDYVIVYEGGSLIFDGSLSTLDAASNTQSVTISNNTISAAEGDPYCFTVAAVDGGYSVQSAGGYYIGRTSDSNGLTTSKTTVYTNTISLNDDGTANIVSGGAYLRYNTASNQLRFRYYKSTTYTAQKAIALYAKESGGSTVYYTTVLDVASEPVHVHTVAYFEGQAATCEAEGIVAYYYCSDETCPNYGTYYSDAALTVELTDLTVPALGHDMVAGTVHPATCTEEGYTEYACSRCDATDIGDIVAALGHSYGYTDNGDGTHAVTCANCGDTYNEAHTFTAGT